jgi:hypothetical protein
MFSLKFCVDLWIQTKSGKVKPTKFESLDIQVHGRPIRFASEFFVPQQRALLYYASGPRHYHQKIRLLTDKVKKQSLSEITNRLSKPFSNEIGLCRNIKEITTLKKA